MLRRAILTTPLTQSRRQCGASVVFTTAFRHGGGGGAPKAALPGQDPILASQNYRTVSDVVPGKAFMFTWIATEQSASSITNRVLSAALTFVLGLGVALYGVSVTSQSFLTLMM
eukprot:PhF_6_TR23837/c0_g1_i3/m.33426